VSGERRFITRFSIHSDPLFFSGKERRKVETREAVGSDWGVRVRP